jgi:hypothetical protein
VGKDSYKEKVIWSFDITDGYAPVAGLTVDSAGNLYGTTCCGGPQAEGPFGGVVFEVTP